MSLASAIDFLHVSTWHEEVQPVLYDKERTAVDSTKFDDLTTTALTSFEPQCAQEALLPPVPSLLFLSLATLMYTSN